MSKIHPDVLALPLSERGLIALRAAVRKAIEDHARAGLPIYVERDGERVKIPADQLIAESGHSQPRST